MHGKGSAGDRATLAGLRSPRGPLPRLFGNHRVRHVRGVVHGMTPGGPDACWVFVEKYRREHAPGHPPPEKPRWPPRN
jgi:hypothetical protein